MTEKINNSTKKNDDSLPYRFVDWFFYVIRGVGVLVREFGMPVVAFGAGIGVVIILLQYDGPHAIKYKIAVGLILVVIGLFTQIVIHFHDNPRDISKPPPIDPVLGKHLKDLTMLLGEISLSKNRKTDDK